MNVYIEGCKEDSKDYISLMLKCTLSQKAITSWTVT